jgi:hypothetical protein
MPSYDYNLILEALCAQLQPPLWPNALVAQLRQLAPEMSAERLSSAARFLRWRECPAAFVNPLPNESVEKVGFETVLPQSIT